MKNLFRYNNIWNLRAYLVRNEWIWKPRSEIEENVNKAFAWQEILTILVQNSPRAL